MTAFPDLYVANGYISGVEQRDVSSFFWRQVVAKSPQDSSPSPDYERGWSAINELIRSDSTWNGHERNVFFANNRDGTFSDVSGVVGLDFRDDSRAFALADFDGDGRLEIVLKNRNAPQIRILRLAMDGIGNSIAFRLRGDKSNRDAIGAAVTIEMRNASPDEVSPGGFWILVATHEGTFLRPGKESGRGQGDRPMAQRPHADDSTVCPSTIALKSAKVRGTSSPSRSLPLRSHGRNLTINRSGRSFAVIRGDLADRASESRGLLSA